MSRARGDRMDPRIDFPPEILPGVGPQFQYDPVTNPFGARADVYDHTVNVYGTIRNTPFPGSSKFAQRPLDNVGVQYGLGAMNDGKISVEDFLDLNANMGGVDIDFNRVPNRTVHYADATKRAYQGGRILSGGGGLAARRSSRARAATTSSLMETCICATTRSRSASGWSTRTAITTTRSSSATWRRASC